MAKINLEKMSLEELKALQKDVEKAIADFEARKRKEALEAVKAAAKEKGFSLEQLVGNAAPRKARAKNPAKYAHPENASLTWSGRGRQPGWIKEALDAGKELEEFAI